MKKIALITINYNREKITHEFLKSVAKLKNTPDYSINIFVIDNGSKEIFKLTAEEKKLGNIKILRTEDNLGFTGGNNTGFKYALKNKYDYIMILNNDTDADKDLVKNLFAAAEKNPRLGLLGPKIYFTAGHEYHKDRYKKSDLGKVFWYAGGFMDWANIMSTHRGIDEVDHGQYDKQQDVEFVSGCCMFMRREVLETVGLFEPRYFLYCEDADLNQRIKRAGYMIQYVPSAKLWHNAGGSTGGIGSKLQDYFSSRNRMLFGLRFAPIRSKIALIRESWRLLLRGREWQKKGIRDFYLNRFYKGSFPL